MSHARMRKTIYSRKRSPSPRNQMHPNQTLFEQCAHWPPLRTLGSHTIFLPRVSLPNPPKTPLHFSGESPAKCPAWLQILATLSSHSRLKLMYPSFILSTTASSPRSLASLSLGPEATPFVCQFSGNFRLSPVTRTEKLVGKWCKWSLESQMERSMMRSGGGLPTVPFRRLRFSRVGGIQFWRCLKCRWVRLLITLTGINSKETDSDLSGSWENWGKGQKT